MEKIVVQDLGNQIEDITIEEVGGEEFQIIEDKRIMRGPPGENGKNGTNGKDGKSPSKTEIKEIVKETLPPIPKTSEIEAIIDKKIEPLPTREEILDLLDEQGKAILGNSFEIERKDGGLFIKAKGKEYFIERYVGSRGSVDTLQSVTERGATTTIESTFSGGLKLAGAGITGIGNLRLRDSATASDGILHLDGGYYKFLTSDENPAILEGMGLSIADATSPAMKGYIGLNEDNFFFLNGAGNSAQLNTGGIGLWDVMDSGFSTIKLDNHQFQFKDSGGYWSGIATGGQLFMYDMVNDGSGYIEHSDSDYIFKNYAGDLTRIVGAELNLTGQMLADNAYLGSVTTLGNYLQLFAVNRRMTVGNLGIAGGNYIGISFDNSPSITTYAILGDDTNTFVNAKSGGTLYSRINNNTVGSFTATLQTSNVPFTVVGTSPNLTLESSAGNAVNAGTITMRTPGGAESCTLRFNASTNIFEMLYGVNNAITYSPTAISLNTPSSASGGIVTVNATANSWTNTTLVNKIFSGGVTIQQGGTAGFALIDIGFIQSSIGSGEKILMRFLKSGTGVFTVDYLGRTAINKSLPGTILGMLDIVTDGTLSDTIPSIVAGKVVTSGTSLGASFRNLTATTGNSALEIAGLNAGSARVVHLRTDSSGNFDVSTGSTTFGSFGTSRLRVEAGGKVTAQQGGTTLLAGVVTTRFTDWNVSGNIGTGEDDLESHSTPGSTFNQNGDNIFLDTHGAFANNANLKRLRLYFAGIAIFDTTALAFQNSNWRIQARIFRVSTTSAKAVITFTSSDILLPQSQVVWSGSSLNLLGTNIIKTTGEATADNDIISEAFVLTWLPTS